MGLWLECGLFCYHLYLQSRTFFGEIEEIQKFDRNIEIGSPTVETQDFEENIETEPHPVETQDVVSLRGGEMQMKLSPIGKIAQSCWKEIPEYFPFVKLGAYIIMPNHVHGIVIINKKDDGRKDKESNLGTAETKKITFRQHINQHPLNKFGPQSKNLASIIRGFKVGVTKSARKISPNFKWQSRFYDHIIRDEKSFQSISKYIINNPQQWKNEKLYK